MLNQILTESINDKGKFKAIFLAGAPGAGKSYTSKKIIDGGIQPRIVNPDKFYEYFLFNDKSLDLDIMDTTVRLLKKQLFFYVDGMLPLLVDTTSSSIISTIRRKAMLEAIGYDTGLCWVDTDLEIALQRNRERNRVVDEDFLKHAHDSIQKNVNYLKSHFKFYKRIDNNQEIMDNSVILSSYKAVRQFYREDLHNKIGIDNVKAVMEAGESYLTPTVYTKSELQSDLDIWYSMKQKKAFMATIRKD